MSRPVARSLTLVVALGLALGLVATSSPNPAAAIDPCFGYDLCVHETVGATGFGDETGAGWVTSTPAGIHCRFVGGQPSPGGSSTCDWYFHANFVSSITVRLDAVADTASNVACSAHVTPTPSCSDNLTFEHSVSSSDTFEFVHDPIKVTIGNAGLPGGFVYSTPVGIDCGEQYTGCSKTWPWGTVLTLYAEGDNGGLFQSWSGYCEKNNESCEIGQLQFDIDTTANFGYPATPTPPSTPKPTVKPSTAPGATPGSTPRPGTTPQPTAPSGTGGLPAPTGEVPTTATPGATDEMGQPGGQASGAPTPANPGGSAVAVALGTPGSSGVPEAPVGATAPADLMPIVIAIVIAGGLIAMGIVAAALVGRRGRRGEQA